MFKSKDIITFSLTALLCGATAFAQDEMPPPPPPPPASQQSASPAMPDPSKVVITVEGEDITQGQLMQMMQQAMMQYSQQVPQQQLQQMAGRIYQDVQNRAIADILLKKEADASGVEVPDEKINEQIERAKGGLPEGMTLENALEQSGMTLEGWKADMKEQMKMQVLIEKAVANVPPVTNEDIKAFYDGNPEMFKNPESVTASHILIKSVPEDTDEQKAAKIKSLEDIKAKIVAGADFAEMAKEHSEGPSNVQGGSLGTFRRGQMVPPFDQAVFSMKPGELSDIVETQFGYHLIKVTDKSEAGVQALDDIKDQLSAYLDNQKKQEAVMAYIGGLREKADITFHNEQ
jgi:peptidyl-prolyl cis-trans isomerase C